jgi:hypothetical protein
MKFNCNYFFLEQGFGIKIRKVGDCPADNIYKIKKGGKKGSDCNQIVGETAGLSALS